MGPNHWRMIVVIHQLSPHLIGVVVRLGCEVSVLATASTIAV
jgi:hypothetical protein